jgi:hypothetical protein
MSQMSDSYSRPSLMSVVSGAGALIRYSFYFIGALVLGVIGIALMSAYGNRTQVLDEPPSFRVAAPSLTRFPARTQIMSGERFGRMEMMQYGSFHNRDVNFTLAMGFPPASLAVKFDLAPQLASLRPQDLRSVMSSNYHDLETRFGAVRAIEARIENDGQWKQCLAFASRFETTALYLIGWYCDASGAKPNAASLACMVDKLTLDRPLASKEADSFLRTQAARPASCSAVPVSQTTDTRTRSSISPPQRWSTPSSTYNRY